MNESKKNTISKDYEESKNLLQTIVDYSWNKYHKQHEHFDSLDQKAATFAGFIGIIITLVTAFSYNILKIPFIKDGCLQFQIIILKLFLLLIICLLAIAFYYSIVALRIRKVSDPSSINELLNYNQELKQIKNIHKRHKQLLVGITKSLSRSEASIKNCNIKKSSSIKKVTLFLIISLVLGFIEILIFFINSIYTNS